MKITKSRLTQIIKEEIGRLANKVREGGDINVAKGKVDMLIGLHTEGKQHE